MVRWWLRGTTPTRALAPCSEIVQIAPHRVVAPREQIAHPMQLRAQLVDDVKCGFRGAF
jgi:hypothetical protein